MGDSNLIILPNDEDVLWHRMESIIVAFSNLSSEEYPYWSDLLYSKAVELQALYQFVVDNNIIPPCGTMPHLTEGEEVE